MNYKYNNGSFAPTACIRSMLINKSYFAPRQNQTYSESLLFGISGGIGIGYILWNYKTKKRIQLSLHFHNHWGKEIRTMTTICKRLGLEYSIIETTSSRKAYNNLRVLLDKGEYAIVWVDRNKLPYNYEPLDKYEKSPYPVIIVDLDKETGTVTIDDLAGFPFEISMEELKLARRNIPSLKNSIIHIKNYAPPEHLSTIIRAGIEDFIEKMSTTSQSFSLPALNKWARLLPSTTNKKGWPVIFTDNTHLFTVLAKIYENTALYCKDGHGLRYMYADFLDEASSYLNLAKLKEIAGAYREAGDLWTRFANTALCDSINEFKTAKELLQQKHQALNNSNEKSQATLESISKKVQEIYLQCADNFPLDRKETLNHFNEMAADLMKIYQIELKALNSLYNVMNQSRSSSY